MARRLNPILPFVLTGFFPHAFILVHPFVGYTKNIARPHFVVLPDGNHAEAHAMRIRLVPQVLVLLKIVIYPKHGGKGTPRYFFLQSR